jgi:predicted deacylase
LSAYVSLVPLAAEGPVDGMSTSIAPGPGVTETRLLSDYFPALAATAGDTRVYILDSRVPGGTLFIGGGAHSNEAAGIVAAILFVEKAKPIVGRIIVVPYSNNSGSSYGYDGIPSAERLVVATAKGPRTIKIGNRLTKPEDQGEIDPESYAYEGSDQSLEGYEARNLDRAHPGSAEGNLTRKIAYGLITLLRREGVDVAFDLHEAKPDSKLAMQIIANPKNIDIAANAALDLEEKDITMRIEASPVGYRGLSHREWGDQTDALSFLLETPNPAMADGRMGADQVDDPEYPLGRRVGVQLECIDAVMRLAGARTGNVVKYEGLPTLEELERDGIGAYLE